MVGCRLCKSIKRMEGVAGKRSRDEPSVMIFVDIFVDLGVVKPTVDPVDKHVVEEQEHKQTAHNSKKKQQGTKTVEDIKISEVFERQLFVLSDTQAI